MAKKKESTVVNSESQIKPDLKIYDKDGFDQDGFDRKGFDRKGFDLNGYDAEGFDSAGYNWEGYRRDGREYNEINRNENEGLGSYRSQSDEYETLALGSVKSNINESDHG